MFLLDGPLNACLYADPFHDDEKEHEDRDGPCHNMTRCSIEYHRSDPCPYRDTIEVNQHGSEDRPNALSRPPETNPVSKVDDREAHQEAREYDEHLVTDA